MKYSLLLLVSACMVFLFTACNTTQSNKSYTPESDTIEGVKESDTIDEDVALLMKYRKEGFIDRNTYSITIVRPSDAVIDEDEVLDQAKKRTLVSFQKYVRTRGTKVDGNVRSALLNLINEHGTMKKLNDTEKSRTVFVFLVERDNLKRYVDSL